MKLSLRAFAIFSITLVASLSTSAASWSSPARSATIPSLYVADAAHSAVSRFQLDRDIPVQPAAGTLLVDHTPWHIAVGPPGLLFVAYASPPQVDVFDSSATGHAKPLRSVVFSAPPSGIAVDRAGYLYVSGLRPGAIEIFGPLAHGRAQPVAHVVAGVRSPTTMVAVDPEGRLFFANSVSGTPAILEFADPLTTPVAIRAVFFTFGARLVVAAIDVTHELYIIQNTSATVDAYSPSSCCEGYLPDRTIRPIGGVFAPLAIVIRHRHAFVSSGFPSKPGTAAVYTFDVFHGTQTPLSVISGPSIAAPVAVAVDP